MPAVHPTPQYQSWANEMLARLVPRAAELRADPGRGAQNRAAAIDSIIVELRARAAGVMPAAPPRPARPIEQADLFL